MWDERYSNPEYVYGTEPNQFLAAHFNKIPKGRVLEIGAGEGRNGVFLAIKGYQVTAVDQSGVGLKKARRLAEEKGVEIETIEANLAEFKIEPGAWDGIVAIFCHLPRDLRSRVFADSIRGLAPNGVFLLEFFTTAQLKYNTGGPKDPTMLYSLTEAMSDFKGLAIEHAEELEREVNEGRHHSGTAAVIQLIARKS